MTASAPSIGGAQAPGANGGPNPRRYGGIRPLLLLAVLAVAVRVPMAWTRDPGGLTWADEVTYDSIAWNLARTGHYVSGPYEATPGEPAFLAAVYAIAGHSFRAARLAQAVAGGILAVVVAAIGFLLFDRRAGYLAGIGVALYPPLVYMSATFYAEHLAALLLAATVLALAWWRTDPNPLRLLGAGAILGLAVLTRPLLLAVLPVALIYAARPRDLRQTALNAAAVLLGLALVVGPWTIRNTVTFGHPVVVSTGAGLHLWRGNNPLANGGADDRHLYPGNALWYERFVRLDQQDRLEVGHAMLGLLADLDRLDAARDDARLRKQGVRYIADHPWGFVKRAARRVSVLYSAFSHTVSQNEVVSRTNRWIARISFYPVLLLALLGAWWSWKRRPSSRLLHGTLLFTTLAYACLTASTRFRFPLDPLLILMAAATVVALVDRWGSDGARGHHDEALRVPQQS